MLKLNQSAFLLLCILLLALGLFSNLFAQLPNQATPTTSSVVFLIKNAGVTTEGKFEKFKSTIDYNSKEPEKSTFEGVIETQSISTGINLRDKHLRDAPYFECAKYPFIKFKSTQTKKLNDGTLEVSGNLTIKQTTRLIKLIVRVTPIHSRTVFTTELKINRLDFGVGESSWTLSNDLWIKLAILD